MYDLYKKIANEYEESHAVINHLTDNVVLEEKDIPTLLMIHAEHFQGQQNAWRRICLFEQQFYLAHKTKLATYNTPEKMISEKVAFYQTCQDAYKLGSDMLRASQDTMVRRIQRKRVGAELQDEVHIYTHKTHMPTKIENDIIIKINRTNPGFFKEVICVDSDRSKELNSIYIYMSCASTSTQTQQTDVAKHIYYVCSTKHGIQQAEVIFYLADTFDEHAGKMDRFEIRDNVIKGQYDSKELSHHVVLHDDMEVIEDHEEELQYQASNCLKCFGDLSNIKPLHMKTFDVCSEWLFDMPAPMQYLLYPFINATSLKVSKTKSAFVQGKIGRLYGLYDTLLNISNFKYHGIQQETTSVQMTMNYRSVNTLFKLTSDAGASQSLDKAEASLKERSNPEKLYHDAYLRYYDLQYETDAGVVINQVRMRDTYPMLRLDNLVRWRLNDDPNPGESRSKQMSTLPVSLEGLPRDSAIVNTWHDPNICNDLETCNCKLAIPLGKLDVKRVLLELSPEDAGAMSRFQKLVSWGFIDHLRLALKGSKYTVSMYI